MFLVFSVAALVIAAQAKLGPRTRCDILLSYPAHIHLESIPLQRISNACHMGGPFTALRIVGSSGIFL